MIQHPYQEVCKSYRQAIYSRAHLKIHEVQI